MSDEDERKSPMQYVEEPRETDELPIDYPTVVLMIGKSRSGKTHLLKWILYNEFMVTQRFKFGKIYCKTLFTKTYDFLPDHAKCEKFDMDEMMTYVQNMRDHIDKTSEEIPGNFIIFDDMLGEIGQYQKEFMNFIATCRHTNTTVFMLVQQLGKGAGTVVKEQTGAAFMFKSGTEITLKAFYDYFGSIIPSYQAFKDKFRRATSEKFSAMLYLGGAERDDEQKNFYSVKAPEKLPSFKIKF